MYCKEFEKQTPIRKIRFPQVGRNVHHPRFTFYKHTFKYKGFTYLYESEEQFEDNTDHLSALKEEWQKKDNDDKDEQPQSLLKSLI
ncbi:Uncharacterized protein APZ42_002896 [Daphnia magna]|uniref:Uncharacterized protein n=1 Tax=Daphnia magna TaxID=35525 RepID=A0A164HYV3_9CRUS|nr:Uncharacterized protein APZ42_002896 [Daphnia magna]